MKQVCSHPRKGKSAPPPVGQGPPCSCRHNNKKGATGTGMRLIGTKGSIKKASMQKKWDELMKIGLEGLKLNPWDGGLLTEIGRGV